MLTAPGDPLKFGFPGRPANDQQTAAWQKKKEELQDRKKKNKET